MKWRKFPKKLRKKEEKQKNLNVRTPDALKTKIITAAVACVATIAVVLGVAAATVAICSVEKAPKADTVKTSGTKDKNKEEKEKINPDDLIRGESICIPEKAGIKIDTSYSFAKGKKLSSTALEYKTLRNSEFGYKCDIPSEFVFLSDADGEIRYGAVDKTAYMDIGAFSNIAGVGAAEVKDMISDELGAAAEYEVSGDDWFIMRTTKSGIVYYHKCFASSDFVRYIEFVYPSEYSEIYDVYVNDIESTFEKTN